MRIGRSARPLCSVLSACLLAPSLMMPMAAQASQTIRCQSDNYRYRYCRVDTDYRVRLERQFSKTHCRQGDTWGFDRRGVWVDRGCDAEFRVGSGSGRDDDKGNNKALAVGAAIAGVAILAAIANRNDKGGDVASWAVGRFQGYDERERANVDLTILPGGSVSGSAGRHEFTGRLEGDRLGAGRYTFRIERSSNGFLAKDDRDDRHRVYFRRTDGGY